VLTKQTVPTETASQRQSINENSYHKVIESLYVQGWTLQSDRQNVVSLNGSSASRMIDWRPMNSILRAVENVDEWRQQRFRLRRHVVVDDQLGIAVLESAVGQNELIAAIAVPVIAGAR